MNILLNVENNKKQLKKGGNAFKPLGMILTGYFISFILSVTLTGCFVPLKKYEKKAHAVKGLVKKVKALQRKNEDLESKLKIVTKKYTETRKKLANYDVSMKALESSLDERERETETLSSNLIMERESKYKEISESKKFLEETNEKLRKQINELLVEKKSIKSRLIQLTDEKEKFEKEIMSKIDDVTFENQNLVTVKMAQEKEIRDLMNQVSGLEKRVRKKIISEKKIKGLRNNIYRKLKNEIQAKTAQVTSIGEQVWINILTDALFDKNNISSLRNEGKTIIKKIAPLLKALKGKKVIVEGHTDSRGIGASLKERFPSNWDLSSQRSVSIVRYLSEALHVNPKILSSSGHSSFKPVGDNDTEQGRYLNRRIVIIIKKE